MSSPNFFFIQVKVSHCWRNPLLLTSTTPGLANINEIIIINNIFLNNKNNFELTTPCPVGVKAKGLRGLPGGVHRLLTTFLQRGAQSRSRQRRMYLCWGVLCAVFGFLSRKLYVDG